MNVNRIIAKEMAYSKTKCIHGNVMGNISPDIEWLKWLSYEPKFEQERIEYLNSKKVGELSFEEIQEASTYKKNQHFAKLFKIYGTKECSCECYMKVYDYMCTESIEKLMLSKLSSDELQYARGEILRLSEIPCEQLNAKVKEEQKKENYENLSMVDSYILHEISNVNYARNLSSLNREIKSQLEENDRMRRKSLHHYSKFV